MSQRSGKSIINYVKYSDFAIQNFQFLPSSRIKSQSWFHCVFILTKVRSMDRIFIMKVKFFSHRGQDCIILFHESSKNEIHLCTGYLSQGLLDTCFFNLLFLVFSFVFRQYKNRSQPNEWQSKRVYRMPWDSLYPSLPCSLIEMFFFKMLTNLLAFLWFLTSFQTKSFQEDFNTVYA